MRNIRLKCLAAALLLAALFSASPASATLLISINKSTQTMAVSLNGRPLWNWPVSTGRARYETPSGRYTPFRLEEDHFSKEWDDAPMPRSIFFTRAGHAIHGTYETRHLGRRASHGCVRLSTGNAARLFALVKQHGLSNTRVVLFNERSADPDAVASRSRPRRAPAAVQEAAPRETAPAYGMYGVRDAGGPAPVYGWQPGMR